MSPPQAVIIVIALYLCVAIYGPKLMKNRTEYDLKIVIQLYNVSQMLLCGYIFVDAFTVSWISSHNLACQAVDYSDSPLAMRMANIAWFFFLSKVVDLLDTVFFILRKKKSQISFLHVYHHSTMVLVSWLYARYAPGGQSFSPGMLNAFVHTIMYTYYFLSTLGPRFQPFLWWKKYLTQLQLIQFGLNSTHAWLGYYIDCDYPSLFTFINCFYPLTMIPLFIQFYFRSYSKQKKP